VNDFILADLPGYGYARVPGPVRAAWHELIEDYLPNTSLLRGVLVLIDARRSVTEDDQRLVDFLGEFGIPLLFVITKIDKISRSRRAETLRDLQQQLGVSEDQILATSAQTREGIPSLLDSIEAFIHSPTGGES
jgi:GTP-binding protein